MMVDEADVDVGMLSRGTKRPLSDPGSPKPNNRRKPGPLPKDYTANRGNLSPKPVPNVFSKLESLEKLTETEKPLEPVVDKSKPITKNVLGNILQKSAGVGVLKNLNIKNSVPGNSVIVTNSSETDVEEMDVDIEVNGIRG